MRARPSLKLRYMFCGDYTTGDIKGNFSRAKMLYWQGIPNRIGMHPDWCGVIRIYFVEV